MKPFTARQGQYLAFIYWYTKLNRVPPAEADFQRYFQVTPPAVHDMILKLEAGGWITRTPRGRPLDPAARAARGAPRSGLN
jgi:repressor LexA